MWLLLAVMKVCLPTYKLPLSQRWNFSTWLKCSTVTVSWFSVSNSEWDHRQWKEGTVCHPLLPLKGSSGNGISTLNLDCGSCEYHHLSQLWLDQKASLGKIFRIRWIWLIRFEVTKPYEVLHGVGRNFSSYFFFFFLRQRFQLETVPSLHTSVLGFLFGASNSCDPLKINQASHQGTKRILLWISIAWNLHRNTTSEANAAWHIWTFFKI